MPFRKKTDPIARAAVAEELASIRTRRLASSSAVSTEFGRRFSERLSEIQHAIWVELMLTHYTNQQLQALSEFYRTETGLSIVETDRQIEKEFQEELRARVAQLGQELEAERVSQPESTGSKAFLASSFETRRKR
jgi:hypothetical protein